jgi:hypothetical protein
MIRAQPMLVLDDVEGGSDWFCTVLGVTSGHGGADYEMLMDGNEIVAQLHHWQHEVWLRGPEGYTVVVAGARQPFTG